MTLKKITSTWIAGLFCLTAAGQGQPLTVEGAIQAALSQNYSIQVSRNNVEATENLANRGQAGQLPTVNGTGTIDYGLDNTRLQIAGSPDVIETNGAQSTTYNAAVTASYTLFAGRANALTYNKLLMNADLSDAQSRLEVEGTIMQVISAYYNVLRAQDNLVALQETMALSHARLDLSEKQRELSGGSKGNVLSARVDLNKDSVNLVQAQQSLQEAEIAFNQLLGRALETPVELTDEALTTNVGSLEAVREQMKKQNWQVQLAKLNSQASMLDYKIAKSAYMPRLDLNSSYNYNLQNAEGSFLELNEANGLGIMLTLSVPIYNAGRTRTAVKNAEITMKNRALELKDAELAIDAELLKAYRNYELAQSIVFMEQNNLQLNEENFEYTNEQYRLGLVSNTQFREAQVNLLLTRNNLNNVRYNLRLAELELLRLTGGLVRSI